MASGLFPRQPEIRERLARRAGNPVDGQELVQADLTSDPGWSEALDGVQMVCHVASPVPHGGVAHGDEDALIGPAREGTLRVLRAGALPGYPPIWLPIVDVRDVARAHVDALSVREAAGLRFLLGSGQGLSVAEVGAILRAEPGPGSARVPESTAEDLSNSAVVIENIDTDRARRVLGFCPRDARQTVLDTARA